MLAMIKVISLLFILSTNFSLSYQNWNKETLMGESIDVQSGNPFKPKAGCDDGKNAAYLCDKDERFPSIQMREIIYNLKFEHKVALGAFSKVYRPKRVNKTRGGHKKASSNKETSEPVCPIASQIHYPQKAKNILNKWR